MFEFLVLRFVSLEKKTELNHLHFLKKYRKGIISMGYPVYNNKIHYHLRERYYLYGLYVIKTAPRRRFHLHGDFVPVHEFPCAKVQCHRTNGSRTNKADDVLSFEFIKNTIFFRSLFCRL